MVCKSIHSALSGFLLNVRGACNSSVIEADEQMNLKEIILDLEAICESLHIPVWAFAGHSSVSNMESRQSYLYL